MKRLKEYLSALVPSSRVVTAVLHLWVAAFLSGVLYIDIAADRLIPAALVAFCLGSIITGFAHVMIAPHIYRRLSEGETELMRAQFERMFDQSAREYSAAHPELGIKVERVQ